MPGAAAGKVATGGRQPTASERRRMYRDLAQSLRCGLRDASAGFSFLRLRGLRALLRALRSAADADARLFRHSQALRDLQVVPVLFEHSLRRAHDDAVVTVGQVLGISPAVKLRNPATDSEVALALRVLEGCCLLCRDCAAAAHRYDAVKAMAGDGDGDGRHGGGDDFFSFFLTKQDVLLNFLMTRGTLEQKACLDTLLALMVDSSENLMDFKEHGGLDKIVDLVKDTQRDDNVRLKCAEFLLLFSRSASEKGDATFFSCMQEDFKNIVGENCASFICSKNFFSSTLDSEVTEPELNIHAKHNFKSSNLLLDSEFSPHLSDAGLASFISDAEFQAAQQSAGCTAPEVDLTGQYTLKSDYSTRPRSEQSLVRWATPQLHDIDALERMVDPALKGLYPAKSLSRYNAMKLNPSN
uniref:Uncharacterized protein n=1 Tax=Oryza punctata TaxID=4537 RepID=A0A0E0M9V0_ORYPU